MTNSADRNIVILLILILLIPVVLTVLFYYTGEPIIVPTATHSPSPTLTAVNITPKPTLPSLTPTQEWACQLTEETGLYRDKALTDLIVLLPEGQNMLLTDDYTDTVWWGVTADGVRMEGYLSREALRDDCP